jgi:hypothetical protein
VVRDDTDDMVRHVAYLYLRVAQLGQPFDVPSELIEEEELAVAVLIGTKEEKRAFPGLNDALALSVVPPPPPRPPQPPRTPSMPCRARDEPWDAWPGATPTWPGISPPFIGWAPLSPAGPPPPPIAAWPWP